MERIDSSSPLAAATPGEEVVATPARDLVSRILTGDDPVGWLLRKRDRSSPAEARRLAEQASRLVVSHILSQGSSLAATPIHAGNLADFLYRARIHLD